MNELDWRLLEERTALEFVEIAAEPHPVRVHRGDRVRLRPRKGGDVFDIALSGRTAIVESLEEDYEGRRLIAVVVEEDPGQDMGLLRQPGHRFFFSPEEVEPITGGKEPVA